MKRLSGVLRVFPSVGIRCHRSAAQTWTPESNAQESHEFLRSLGVLVVIACVLVASPHTANAQAETGPTAASALAADDDLSKAIRENNADGIARWLDKDWGVVSARGDMGEGPSIFPDGIKAGVLTRTTFETSEPRVRVFDNVALVTTKVRTSGMFGGKPFDVVERQTDVWLWKDGGWKCVLTHETLIPAKAS
jgi:ketosteroid isomerase-like protein